MLTFYLFRRHIQQSDRQGQKEKKRKHPIHFNPSIVTEKKTEKAIGLEIISSFNLRYKTSLEVFIGKLY